MGIFQAGLLVPVAVGPIIGGELRVLRLSLHHHRLLTSVQVLWLAVSVGDQSFGSLPYTVLYS